MFDRNLWISLTATFSKLIPFLGRISNGIINEFNPQMPFTQKIVGHYSKQNHTQFRPLWDTSPGWPPIRQRVTNPCSLRSPVRKALIQLIKTVSIWKDANSLRRIQWSIRSKPLEASAIPTISCFVNRLWDINQGVRGGVPLPCVLARIKFFRNLLHEPAARKPFHDFGKGACQRDSSQTHY